MLQLSEVIPHYRTCEKSQSQPYENTVYSFRARNRVNGRAINVDYLMSKYDSVIEVYESLNRSRQIPRRKSCNARV